MSPSQSDVMGEPMQAKVLYTVIHEPFDRVVTKCGKAGRVIFDGPKQEYLMAEFDGLGICRVDMPEQHARFLHHEKTGEWPE